VLGRTGLGLVEMRLDQSVAGVLDDRCADGLEGLRRKAGAPRGEIRRNQLGCLVLALVPSGSYPSE